jgi:hypothetical protein
MSDFLERRVEPLFMRDGLLSIKEPFVIVKAGFVAAPGLVLTTIGSQFTGSTVLASGSFVAVDLRMTLRL